LDWGLQILDASIPTPLRSSAVFNLRNLRENFPLITQILAQIDADFRVDARNRW
jgi:hypothetical protein